jgi:prepilin-type N-terminal cleavage/methylation domain-containing protein
MSKRRAYSLAELIVVVAILALLSAVAIPRFQFGLVRKGKAEAAAWEVVTALRLTRRLAISQAAENAVGYALRVDDAGGDTICEIVDLTDSSVVDSLSIDSAVTLSGGRRFEFDTLGAVKTSSDSELNVSAEGKSLAISIVPATGMVKCREQPSP